MPLYLHCVICSRKQADGLISGMAWGRLELPAGTKFHHPGVNGSTLRACPSCMSDNPDWQSSVLSNLGLASSSDAQANVAI
jgi:hypothetical protein